MRSEDTCHVTRPALPAVPAIDPPPFSPRSAMDLKSLKAQQAKTTAMISELDAKYDNKIRDLIASLEYTQATVEDIKCKLKTSENENKRLSSELDMVRRENTTLQAQLKEREERLDYLDDQGRRNNLRISGVPEQNNENWEQCQHRVTKLLQEHLNISPSFERVHRVGKYSPQQTRPRDIVAKFPSFPQREAVFRDRRKLKGTNIYLNEDLCPGSTAARREQLPRYHEARRQGKFVYFNYRTLVVKEAAPNHTRRPLHSTNSTQYHTTVPTTTPPQQTSPRCTSPASTSPHLTTLASTSPRRTSPATASTTSTSPHHTTLASTSPRRTSPPTTPHRTSHTTVTASPGGGGAAPCTASMSTFPPLPRSSHRQPVPSDDLSLPTPLTTRDPPSTVQRKSQRYASR